MFPMFTKVFLVLRKIDSPILVMNNKLRDKAEVFRTMITFKNSIYSFLVSRTITKIFWDPKSSFLDTKYK